MQYGNELSFHPSTNGRLLIYDPAETVVDGHASDLTGGFFDSEDAPPWDTWIVFIGREERQSRRTEYGWWPSPALISWVPTEHIASVDIAISANATDCIRWLDEIDSAVARHMASLNIFT